MKFVAMAAAQWDKINSQTGEARLDNLRKLIKTGEAMPTNVRWSRDRNQKATKDNLAAVDELERSKKAVKFDTDNRCICIW